MTKIKLSKDPDSGKWSAVQYHDNVIAIEQTIAIDLKVSEIPLPPTETKPRFFQRLRMLFK